VLLHLLPEIEHFNAEFTVFEIIAFEGVFVFILDVAVVRRLLHGLLPVVEEPALEPAGVAEGRGDLVARRLHITLLNHGVGRADLRIGVVVPVIILVHSLDLVLGVRQQGTPPVVLLTVARRAITRSSKWTDLLLFSIAEAPMRAITEMCRYIVMTLLGVGLGRLRQVVMLVVQLL